MEKFLVRGSSINENLVVLLLIGLLITALGTGLGLAYEFASAPVLALITLGVGLLLAAVVMLFLSRRLRQWRKCRTRVFSSPAARQNGSLPTTRSPPWRSRAKRTRRREGTKASCVGVISGCAATAEVRSGFFWRRASSTTRLIPCKGSWFAWKRGSSRKPKENCSAVSQSKRLTGVSNAASSQ